MIAYFSNVTENTHRFVTRLALPAYRIPLHGQGQVAQEPFVLITPTYGEGRGSRMVPRQVTRYLADLTNASLIRGVIASGNIAFDEDFAAAGDEVSDRFGVPFLYRFELGGTSEDVRKVREGLEQL